MKRQKSRDAGDSHKKKKRILVFDIFRIVCIAIIVYAHSRFDLIAGINQFLFSDGYGPFNIYSSGLQGYAVYGMILISGAVLAYNYQSVTKMNGYLRFLFRRFIRLYPAYWMSLIFSLVLLPVLWHDHFPAVLFEFTGFFVALGLGPGFLNSMGWFIAAIFSLYLLFPWFVQVMRKYGLAALLGFWALSWGLRFLILTYNLVPVEMFWRWFPFCNAFEFCLGIFIVQAALYPKQENTSGFILKLSDLSYYAFIFHIPVLSLFLVYLEGPLARFDGALTAHNMVLGYTLYYCQTVLAILAVSWIAMEIDSRFRTWILRQPAVKNFSGA